MGEDPLPGPLQPRLQRGRRARGGGAAVPPRGPGADGAELLRLSAAAGAAGEEGGGRAAVRGGRHRHVDGEPSGAGGVPGAGGSRPRRRARLRPARRHRVVPRGRGPALPAAGRGRVRGRPGPRRERVDATHARDRGEQPAQSLERPRRPGGPAAHRGPRPWRRRARDRGRGVPRRALRACPTLGLHARPGDLRGHEQPHQGVRARRPALRLDRRRSRLGAADVAPQRPLRRGAGARRREAQHRGPRPPAERCRPRAASR